MTARAPEPPARRCTAKAKSTGARCKKPAIAGGTVCRTHGGAAPQVQAKAARNLAVAEAERHLGGRLDADPGEALLDLVRSAAWDLQQLGWLVATLDVEQVGGLITVVDGDGDPVGVTASPVEVRPMASQLKADSLEAKPHVWIVMRDAKADQLARWCDIALRAGIDERRIRLAETELTRLFEAVAAQFADLADGPERMRRLGAALRLPQLSS